MKGMRLIEGAFGMSAMFISCVHMPVGYGLQWPSHCARTITAYIVLIWCKYVCKYCICDISTSFIFTAVLMSHMHLHHI